MLALAYMPLAWGDSGSVRFGAVFVQGFRY
jgi:hypothetical protein